jgi:hypothetical protein
MKYSIKKNFLSRFEFDTDHEEKRQRELNYVILSKFRSQVCLAQTFGNIEFMGCEYPEVGFEI